MEIVAVLCRVRLLCSIVPHGTPNPGFQDYRDPEPKPRGRVGPT
jgi:hypothetical protein